MVGHVGLRPEPVDLAPRRHRNVNHRRRDDARSGRHARHVDNAPVVVFFGATPMWRNLVEGDVGRDVFQLEANLAALGYDPDQTVDIDETFTANTEAMVERWQEDLGVEVTGEVGSAAIVVVEGPSAVLSMAEVGATAGAQFATLAPRQAVTDVVASIDGTIGDLAAVGQEIGHGSILYSVDTVPVVALAELDEVAAAITSDSYAAVEVEQALVDAGFDPDDEMTVDGVVTDATEAAVERWQGSAGLPVTGSADPGLYVVVAPGQSVDTHRVGSGDVIVAGGPILSTVLSRLSVAVTVDVGEADEFEVGQEVTIELADESTVEGVVVEIGAVVQAADQQATPTVDIDIAVTGAATQALIEGPVTVLSVGELIPGATVIPTRSLVSLAEGGFAVEKADGDGSTTLIGVELGTFNDGVVEVVAVVGGDLVPGDDVVVPK